MLNEFLTWVLNTYLGKYLENFNPAQLSVALVSGEVELENVPIRKDALRSFGIPIEAISGSIGKIKLQIPVRQFRTSPWCIVIEHVYGVFGPKDLNEWDHEKEKQDEYNYKLSVLDAKEATWRLENDCNVESYYSLSYSSWLNYGATLATNILENLELKIKDVHLRYEGTLSSSSSPFSAGIRIQSISAQTCDTSWMPGSKNNSSDNVLYKLFEVKDLCFYWDQLHESNMCSNLTSKDLLINMNDLCKIENHRFVLHPINATAKFKRERCKKAIRSKNRPRVSCAIDLPEVVVELNELQYNEFLHCLSDLQNIKQTRALKISRPTSDIKNNAKIWWKYAAKCHGFSFCSSKDKWRTAKDNIRYINTYKRLLINPFENLSKEDKQFKTEIEKCRSLNELTFLRDISCRNVSARGINVKNRNINQGKSILYYWFPNWLGWCGSEVKSDELYEKIEDDIFNAIKETIENDTFPNRDAIFANFTFSLSNGKISLTTGKNPKNVVLKLGLHNLLSFVDVKPKLSSFCIEISLGLVSLKDELTEPTEFPYIIKPQTQDKQKCSHDSLTGLFGKINIAEDKEPWFQVRYEKNPSDHQSDYKLTINSKSIDVFYNEMTFKWIISFFTKPLNDLKKYMVDSPNKTHLNTQLKFLKNLKSVLMGSKDYRKKWCFEVNIAAPRIIFVENFKDKNTTLFVLDLGRFQLLKDEHDCKSFALLKDNVTDNESEDELFMTPCSTPPGSKISLSVSPTITTGVTPTNLDTSTNFKIVINKDTGLENNLPDEIYDKYIINLTEMQVLVCKNLECTFACSKTSSSFHLLDKFNISIQLERRTIKTSAPEYPAIKLFGNLNKIVAHINEHNITESLRILNQISFDINKGELNSDIRLNNASCDKKFMHESQDTTEYSKTIIFQFIVDQMIIEVQSREKSLAELQIIGANVGLCKQPGKISINMSVHGFLLVDAIQPFGRDFELLVASHRNVKMDSISGSLKQSGPSSSIFPKSSDSKTYQRPSSLQSINKLLNDIGREYEHDDYLIKVEINVIESSGDVGKVQEANITFNNLDIIANQETIMELLGVGKRIIDKYKLYHKCVTEKDDKPKTMGRKEACAVVNFMTKINFDFHRLNILVLRRSKAKSENVVQKVGTLTMIEAKIHAELGIGVCIVGALGGITAMNVAPECLNHQSILSIGMDPLTDLSNLFKCELCSLTNEIYGIHDDLLQNPNALSFQITQIKNTKTIIKMRMASVVYTHCPKFIEEIYICVREFKQFLKNFAYSLRNKATHMAKDFVHHISSNSKSTSEFGNISLDIMLSTPVLVLPRSHESTQMLIANLGQITINNTCENFESCPEVLTRDTYLVDIRNVNFCSVDIKEENDLKSKLLAKAYKIYSGQSNVSAILNNTALSFRCKYESKSQEAERIRDTFHTFTIKGSVTESLDICLSRSQFEQLKDSLQYATHITLLGETFIKTENEDEILEKDIASKLPSPYNFTEIYFEFSVPIHKLMLKNEDNISIIQITFEELSFNLNNFAQQREVQAVLRSVVMEDLKCQKYSKYRYIVDSSADVQNKHKIKNNLSSSCPNLSDIKNHQFLNKCLSIPASLNIRTNKSKSINKNALRKGVETNQNIKINNLVTYKSITTKYANTTKADEINSSLDFNSLNLIISTEKWFIVFDFFGLITNKAENLDVQEKPTLRSSQQFSTKKLEVSVRSLTLILVKNESELFKANISCAQVHISKENTVESIGGRLGSISLFDLTPYGYLYKERFSTSGAEALKFTYKRGNLHQEPDLQGLRTLEKDAYLLIFMSSIKYVHTKRFIVEFHYFMKELLQLQSPVIQQLKGNETRKLGKRSAVKIGLELYAESLIILLPVSYNSDQLLVADLGKLTLVNSFHYATDLTSISAKSTALNAVNEIVDLMTIDLVGINFLTGELENDSQISSTIKRDFNVLRVGTFNIVRLGNAIFKEKYLLKLQVLRNIESDVSHNIPDIKIEGTFSELHSFVNLQQYKLIRGFLNYNLGENIDDVYFSFQFNLNNSIEKLCSLTTVNELKNNQSKWNTLSMNFLLENVVISLADPSEISNQTFACIKFIKSTLEIGSYSDGSMEVDLISTEILVIDARKEIPGSTPDNKFKYILERSIKSSVKSSVQAEIHSRKRNDTIKYTILLNNMRIMAILDFLEKVNNFLKECPCMSLEMSRNLSYRNMSNKLIHKERGKPYEYSDSQLKYEFVLNISNSEIVFVENSNEFDTYAIILKSTTVFSYKSNNKIAPISVDINHLEIFSCILGCEVESSQSIIDPLSLSMELRGTCFQVQMQSKIFLRISYHDVMLFSRIMQSIPKQTKKRIARSFNELRDFEKIMPLLAMGFKHSECWVAMEVSGFNINKAAIWLSQQKYKNSSFAIEINSITLNASCISVCIIDDCFDSDVPLLEVSLSNLMISQNFPKKDEKIKRFYEGEIDTSFTSYYYNRHLSGWEPIIEPWQCIAVWKYSNSNASKTNLSVDASSKQILKLNITSTLLELCGLVRKNWTEDYLKCSLHKAHIQCSNTNTRKRLPFVPFALKNLTGEPLIFNIFFSHAGGITRTEQQQDLMYNWISAQHNEVVPFDFGPQSKLRHLDSHKLNIHQILVQIHGWTLIGPISIDKVGKYFRYASTDMQYQKKSRIVFEISLVGSAQKLIVIRSALNAVNKTSNTFLLRMKNGKESNLMKIKPSEKISIPLQFVDSAIYLKPNFMVETTAGDDDENGFCTRAIQWTSCLQTDCIQEIHSCITQNKEPFNVLSEIKKDKYPVREAISMPGHTITIIPPLKLRNLLCCDLLFQIAGHTQGRLNASKEVEIFSVDINESFCLSITLDNYKPSGWIKIPMGHTGVVEPKLKLVDVFNRELFLRISIQSVQGKGMEILIGAPIWLVNKTGLPLLFRQEGTSDLASAQFDEHEFAREVSPLMFSFSDQEGSPLIEFRLGKSYGNNNKWCKSFGIHKETYSRELMAEQSRVHYVIGISIQKGTGLYNCTTFITLTPRFQLYNRSKHRLDFAQKCDIKEMKITSKDKAIVALPGCSFPFHWPNYEQEPLLCVKISSNGSTQWSSGLPINEAKSVFINVRNELGEMIFLRLEVVVHRGAHILHFTDAYALPPPIRIDNYSDVSIYFSQKGVVPHWRTNVKPQSSLAYVFDDPLGLHTLVLEAPGGNFIDYSFKKNNAAKSITYANFIYIAFKETFRSVLSNNDNENFGIERQQLVLGVRDKRVIITKKCAGDRSQLWLMNSNGQIEHEGSSPPTEFLKLPNLTPRLVLDVEKPPNPTDYTRLLVRPQNNQRAATQTWRFENGRLMCHANMCVQAANGVYGLQPGFDAVLGRTDTNPKASNSNHIPFEQSVEIQKLRPGSGHLEVRNKMDGPIHCVEISDVNINCNDIVLAQDPLWNHASVFNKEIILNTNTVLHELLIKLTLSKGLGISIVTRSPSEELAYISLEDLVFNLMLLSATTSIDLKVKDMQIDNQLLDTACPIILHTCNSNAENTNREALYFKMKLLKSPNKNAVIFECFVLEVKPCTVILEEKFILKAALFLYYKEHWHLEEEEISTNMYHIREYPFSENAKRFYFEDCLFGSTQVRLSVLTAAKLDSELLEIKKYFGLTLIKFEDAIIEFDKFSDRNHFETLDVYLKSLKAHYVTQLKWHAASILGSVDFLGNPLGFANDLSEGVSGLIFEGSVKSLVKNVTHGLSNSTAKLTETLSDSLGRVVLDERDNETRQKILQVTHPTSGGHLTAGLKGFGFGILGGVTSIVRQTYVGAQSDGLPGFISGLGRGIIGTITKPLIGVLDLASETAIAVRETSRGSHHYLPGRKRLPRCVTGAPGGLLPLYSYRQSKGQQYLYMINKRNLGENLIFYEPNLCCDKDAQLRLLVSTEYVRIFSRCDDDPAIMFECHLSEVLSCHPLITSTTTLNKVLPSFYIEISTNVPKVTRPRVRCQNEDIAEQASRCINYAKAVFEERELSVSIF